MANCCTECFLDEYLKERIKEEGALGKCDFCNSKNVYVIDPRDLQNYFNPLVNLYSPQVEFYPVDLLKECKGRFIWEILSEDWDVFDDWEVGRKIIEEMYEPMDPHHDERPLFLDNYVDREDEFYGTDQELSDTLKKQWNEFCEEIAHKNRFFPQKRLNNDLICEILTFSEKTILRDEFLFRARLSRDGKFPLDKMGKPPKAKAMEGRANPVGISYLYLASDANTAISEIRPQVENIVTIGKFRVRDKIRVLDLKSPGIGSPFKWGDNLDFVLKIQGFLGMLGFMLSKPVDKNKTPLEYLPTQYLCEFIKNQDFEGVLYKSFLGSGHDVVLFNERKVECIETKLYKVTSVKVQSEEVVDIDGL